MRRRALALTPTHGAVRAAFVHALLQSLARGEIGGWIDFEGSLVGRQRDALATMFLGTGADVALWIDADQVWIPGTTIPRVVGAVSDETPIVIAPISRRTATGFRDGRVTGPIVAATDGERRGALARATRGGLGFAAVHRSVYERLKAPGGPCASYEDSGDPNAATRTRWAFHHDGRGAAPIGEDVAFFKNAHAAGIEVWCHTGAPVGHVADVPIWPG